jgi:hypothetical protein
VMFAFDADAYPSENASSQPPGAASMPVVPVAGWWYMPRAESRAPKDAELLSPAFATSTDVGRADVTASESVARDDSDDHSARLVSSGAATDPLVFGSGPISFATTRSTPSSQIPWLCARHRI